MDAPKAPDPVATANAQAGMNFDTALTQQLLNFTNQQGPWGSTTYKPTGSQTFVNSQGKTVDIPQYTQTTTYNPAQQAIFDKTTAAQNNIADIASQQSASLRDYLKTGFNFGKGEFTPSAVPNVGSFNAPSYQEVGQFNGPQSSAYGAFNSGQSQPFAANAFSYGESPYQAQNFSFGNQDAANWSYDLASQRVVPQQQRDRAALETQLVNKGIRPGTEAWNSEINRLSQSQGDQLNQLALNGRQQAYNEAFGTSQANNANQLAARGQNFNEAFTGNQQNFNQSLAARGQNFNEALSGQQQNYNQFSNDQDRMFQQALAAQQQNYNQASTNRQLGFGEALSGFQTNAQTALAQQAAQYAQGLGARQQNFQEAVTARNQPINEISALLSGSQLANPNTGFSGTPQTAVGGVDYAGLVGQNFGAQQNAYNAKLGGLFGLAGAGTQAAFMASDRRVKEDIREVGRLDNGLPIYRFRYKAGGPTQIGLMAQDVLAAGNTEAVRDIGGVLHVDYERASA